MEGDAPISNCEFPDHGNCYASVGIAKDKADDSNWKNNPKKRFDLFAEVIYTRNTEGSSDDGPANVQAYIHPSISRGAL